MPMSDKTPKREPPQVIARIPKSDKHGIAEWLAGLANKSATIYAALVDRKSKEERADERGKAAE